MNRAPLCFPLWSRLVLFVFPALVLAARPARAEVVVFENGSRMEILGYELKGDLVVMTAPDGKLLSVPRASIDLDATKASNRAESVSAPCGEALRLLDLRAVTDEIVLAAHRAGEDYVGQERGDRRAESFRAALREGFDADRFYRVAAAAFRESSAELAWNEILPWLQSALVRKLNRLQAQDPSPSSLEEFARTLASSPPSLSRLELVERLDGAAGTSNTAAVMEVALMKTLLFGMNPTLDPARRLSPRQIEDVAERSRPDFLAAARARVRLLLLYRYRQADDGELRQYLSFLESQGGVSLGRAVLESLFVAMADAARRSGELLGARSTDRTKTEI
jgi:hypothetical protein